MDSSIKIFFLNAWRLLIIFQNLPLQEPSIDCWHAPNLHQSLIFDTLYNYRLCWSLSFGEANDQFIMKAIHWINKEWNIQTSALYDRDWTQLIISILKHLCYIVRSRWSQNVTNFRDQFSSLLIHLFYIVYYKSKCSSLKEHKDSQ